MNNQIAANIEEVENPTIGIAMGTLNDEVTLLDILILFAKRKRMIAQFTTTATVGALLISFLIPKMFTAATRILPPQQTQSSAVAMLAQINPLAAGLGKDLGLKSPSDLYISMLRSRTVEDDLVNRFDLRRLYRYKTYVETRKKLEDRTSIAAGKDGTISIAVEDRDAKRSANLANAYVDELYKLTQNLAVTEASQRRLFYERQLISSKKDLADAEVALREIQEKTGLIQLDGQAKAIIESAAGLKAQVAGKEVMLQRARLFATDRNPEYQGLQQELNTLRNQLSRVEQTQAGGNGEIQIATAKVPAAGLEYIRRYRDVKYYETIFELLAKQYEAAKLDEVKDAAIIQVMDQAVEPETKSSPKRGLITAVTALCAFFVALLLVLVHESYLRMRDNPETDMRLQLIRKHLLGDTKCL